MIPRYLCTSLDGHPMCDVIEAVAGAVHASYLHTHWAATADVARRLVAIAASAREVAA